jgi:NAD(P)-dependent dehydrogenase (short-subunit alcohol dehydrogenase family)
MGPPAAGKGTQASSIAFHGVSDDWISTAVAGQPMGRLDPVSEIAEFVVFPLSDRSGVVTGSVIDWDQNVLGAHD